MTTWRKAALGVAAGVAILAVLAAVAIKALIDPAHLAKVARDKAKQAWSRDLRMGDIQLELWPLPALTVRDLKLTHPTDPPILAANVTAELELLPLLIGRVRYRNVYFKDATIQWDGAPWRVEEATIETDTGLRDVRIAGTLWRNRRHVGINAQFDDLSKLGVAGAVTPGQLELDWGQAQLTASGRIPIDGTIANHALSVDVKAGSPKEICDFFGLDTKPRAPFAAQFESRESNGRIAIGKIVASLGQLKVKGDAQYTPGPKPVIDVRIGTERLDWARFTLDAGGNPVPPETPPEMFHDNPLAWWALTGLQGKKGTIEASFGSLLMRNGVELRNLRTRSTFADDKLDMTSFTAEMLGGTAAGSLQLEGKKKNARLTFDGTNLLLERWFKERGGTAPFTGGPMKVTARLASSGNTMRQLAASITGPFNIRMGRGVLASAKAGEAEAKMTSAFSGKGASEITFECAGFALPFKAGRASAERLVGARTAASHLLTSGFIDLRTQTLDLRGRLKGKSGVGWSAIAGDIKITGPIRRPAMALDETAVPKAIARGAAAIATLGLSVMGTAAADSADARRNDPCEAVFGNL